MPRRSLITAISVVVALGLIALAPSLPFVREAIVERVLRIVEGAGVSVAFDRSSGNPWREITLEGARVRAPGADVEVRRLSFGYFLPSLLGGELPVDIDVTGVTGDVDLQELLDRLALAGGGGVSVRVRQIALADVAVNAARLPFTLPDISVDSLTLEQQGTALLLAIELHTSDGRLVADGRYESLTGTFTGDVRHADVSLARAWWQGAKAGAASGPITVRGSLVEGAFQISDAEVDHDGLRAVDVSGEARLRYPVIEAELSGTALGGPVSARGVVNVAAQRWEASGLATAELAQATSWLARDSLPAGLPVDVEGVADLRLSLSGWRRVEAQGEITGSGSLAGVALSDLVASFRLPADGAVRVESAGTLGGAPVRLTLGPGQDGTSGRLTAAGVDLAGAGLPGTVDISAELAGSVSGDVLVAWRGELGGRDLNARLEAVLGPDGWTGFLEGSDAQGNAFEGAAVLRDGRLEGEVTALGAFAEPLTPGARVSVRAAGPLERLQLTAMLTGPQPVSLAALDGGTIDLRGAATGVLAGGRISAISGAFGPLRIAGEAELDPLSARLDVELLPVPTAGDSLLVSLAGGRLQLADGAANLHGELSLSSAASGPEPPLAPPLLLAAELSPRGVVANAAAPDGSIALALNAVGVAGPFDVRLDLAEGTTVAGLELRSPAALSATVSPAQRSASATGTLGTLPVTAAAAWSGTGASLSATLVSSPASELALEVRTEVGSDGAQWSANGAVDLASLLAELGLDVTASGFTATPLRGEVSGSFEAGSLSRTSGAMTSDVSLGPDRQASLALVGRGDGLGVELTGEVDGMPIAVIGSLADAAEGGPPTLSAMAQVGPLEGIAVDTEGASGSGVLSLQTRAGPSGPELTAAVPWAIESRWEERRVTLTIGDGGFDVRLSQGALEVSGAAGASAWLGDEAYWVTLAVGSDEPVRSVTDLKVSGSVAASQAAAANGGALVSFVGSPEALVVEAEIELDRLTGILGVAALEPTGSVSARGLLDVTAGPSYALDLAVSAAPALDAEAFALAGTLAGSGSDARLTLAGAGLDLGYRDGALTLAAADATMAPFLPEGFAGSLAGLLRLRDGEWSGELLLAVTGSGLGAQARLRGAGSALAADVEVEHELGSLAATGTLVPELALSGSLSALAGSLAGDLEFAVEAGLEATLAVDAVALGDLAELPAQTAVLRWRPGAAVTIMGDGIEVVASELSADARVTGTVDLGGSLLGHPVAVAGRLSGTVADPLLDASLTREGVTADLSGGLRRLDLKVSVSEAAIAQALEEHAPTATSVSSLLAGPVTLSGSWTSVAGFELAGTAALAGPLSGAASLHLEGVPGDYTGRLDVIGEGGMLASLPIVGAGAAASASLDLAQVAWDDVTSSLDAAVAIGGGGTVTLTSSPPAAVVVADLRATLGEVTIALTGDSRDALHLAVAGGGLSLAGDLQFVDGVSAELSGEASGAPLTARLWVDSSLGRGSLEVAGVGVNAVAEVARSAGGLALTELSATLQPAGGPLARLGPLAVTASGPLAPSPAVTGTVVATTSGETATLRYEPGDSEIRGGAESVISLDWREVTAAFSPASGEVWLSGDLEVALGAEGEVTVWPEGDLPPGTTLLSGTGLDLTWSATSGVTGVAALATRSPALYRLIGMEEASAALTTGPNGSLALSARAGDEVSLNATLPPLLRSDGGLADILSTELTGTVDFELTISGQLGTLVVSGSPGLSGDLSDPRLAGTVALAGDLTGSGEVSYVDGAGRLVVAGDHLTLDASGTGRDWSVSAALDSWTLPATIPQVGGAVVSLQLAGATAPELAVTVTNLRLAKGSSLVTGGAVLSPALRFALQAQIDLSDLKLGDAHGLMRGPIVLTADSPGELRSADVVAMLDAARVGYGELGDFSGSLQLGGNLADPRVSAVLVGDGAIRGSVRADTFPARGDLRLTSDLRAFGFAADLDVELTSGQARARGLVRFEEAVLVISDAPGGLELAGAGRLEGWRASVNNDLTRAAVVGTLASFSPSLAGEVALAFAGADGSPWLTGTLSGLEVGGVELGTAALSSSSPGAPIVLAGDDFGARFEPAGLAWRLDVSELVLPAGVTLSAAASGRSRTGAGTASLGAVPGGSALVRDGDAVEVDFDLDEEFSLSAAGSLLGGRLSLSGVRAADGTWAGELALADAELSGVRVSAAGLLLGDGLLPGAVVATSAVDGTGQLEARGRLSVSGQGVSLDQQVTLPGASGVVRVQGRALPDTDLLIGAEPSLAAAEAAQVAGAVRLFTTAQGLRSSGHLTGKLGNVELSLGSRAADGVLTLAAALPALEAGLSASFDAESLAGLIGDVARRGLVLQGTGALRGDVVLDLGPEPRAELLGLAISLAGFTLDASGSLSASSADLAGELLLPTDLPVATASGRLSLPWSAQLEADRVTFTSRGELGTFDLAYDLSAESLLADVDLAIPLQGGGTSSQLEGGSVRGRFGYAPGSGASGTLEVADVRLTPAGLGAVTLAADLAVADDRIGGAATVDTAGGRLSLSGNWDLAALLGDAGDSPGSATGPGTVELRVRTLELAAFPAIANALPHVSGAVSGVVQLRGDLLLGQLLVPDLVLGEREAEAFVEITGSPRRVGIAARLLGSLITAEVAGGSVSGSARLERFPAEVLAESVVGPTDVSADLTGVLRFELPFERPQEGYLRLATERFLLERAGVRTEAELSLVYQDSELVVERADFSGRGEWQASGRLGPDLLDFELSAVEADFGPLLGLVPQLARLGAEAQGSFSFVAQGSTADPRISLLSDGLSIEIGGASIGLDVADISLVGDELNASVAVVSGAPAAGRLNVDGRARVLLEPLALREIDFGILGSLAVPGVGLIDEIVGSISLTPDFLPYLRLSGHLGAPLSVSGTLIPLDLRAGGTDLAVSVPSLLIGRAVVDTDLSLRSTPAGIELGGEVRAQEVVIDPEAGSSVEDALSESRAPPVGSGGDVAAPVAGSEPETSPSVRQPLATSPFAGRVEGAALTGLVFSDLKIVAPQRVTFDSSFASLEAAVDLTLSGTAAEPRLSGEASALRGSLRFAGREFTVASAVATFAPARGFFPNLDVVAHTDLEKARALQGAAGVEFVAPDGPSFRITLAFSGPVESAPPGEGGIRFDVRPVLTSDALIEVAGGGGTRALTEAELLTLLTLGRLELNPTLGSSGVGGAVAQGAIDAALDLFVVSELQNALREALGLDVVEIRTSAFSSLIGDAGTPFSVSVRLGGYISPELFASYRIGTRDDPASAFSITNEVTLSYALGPVDLDLTGRLDFPAAGILAAPRPELGFGLRYDFTPSFSADGGVVLSTDRSVVRFGVSLRW